MPQENNPRWPARLPISEINDDSESSLSQILDHVTALSRARTGELEIPHWMTLEQVVNSHCTAIVGLAENIRAGNF